jgi:LacI family transcriptional regulator
MARTYKISEPIRALQDAGIPYVMVSYTDGADVPWVGMDLDSAGYLAAQHLLAMGRRRIGYIGDKFGSIMCELRGRGYRRALEQAGLPVDPDLQFEYPFEGEWNDYRSGYSVAERWRISRRSRMRCSCSTISARSVSRWIAGSWHSRSGRHRDCWPR